MLVGSFQLGEQEGSFSDLKQPLDLNVQRLLDNQGIKGLYRHQAQAIDLARSGQDVMIVTGTASGKSLSYMVPLAEMLLNEPNAKALLMFPTKALGQDQVGRLESFLEGTPLLVSSYDGDTPKSVRRGARASANVILTNPDMLHVGILPQHELWTKFLRSLRLIVIDEIHTYRGVFGGHVAGVIRRLLRLAEWHGARPQVIGCSATIENPLEHFQDLVGRTPVPVGQDTAPKPVRSHYFLATPNDSAETTGESSNSLVARLLVDAITQGTRGYRSLVFCRSRTSVELVLRQARDILKKMGEDEKVIDSYRGGYKAAERRSIESAMFKGKLLGLVSTNAMELGVDIGKLQVVIMNGFPGSVSSYWQQGGRTGRTKATGHVLYVAHDDPYDQAVLVDPHKWLMPNADPVRLAHGNPVVLAGQIKCAAHERALTHQEVESFSPEAPLILDQLLQGGELVLSAQRYFFPSYTSPAHAINLRGSSNSPTQMHEGTNFLGDMEPWRATLQAHPGAIYLHRGEQYEVQSLDLEQGRAELVPFSGRHFTRALHHSEVETTAQLAQHDMGEATLSLLGLRVRTQVTGYQCLLGSGQHVVSEHPLDLPERVLHTLGLRLDLPYRWGSEEFMVDLHGLEHALAGPAPLVASCDRNDIESIWRPTYPETLAPCVIFFDAREGGTGLSEVLFQRFDQWVEIALKNLLNCPCTTGCPKCLLSPRCESANELLSKSGAIELLKRLLALL
ncbi:MAG: DEAD/DEAH box helicase [Fimbriimonadaceae bacterium]|jgi:DEAD/DEAH box helicase domain-containing protein|nr:DEAD/DEAH box helicase [Fimbriimonadaceae bacterium]